VLLNRRQHNLCVDMPSILTQNFFTLGEYMMDLQGRKGA
jgi:hypothetical protein